VWDSLGGEQIEFKSQEAGQDFIGCLVENNAILAALQTRLRTMDHVKHIPFGLKSISPDSSVGENPEEPVDNPWLALQLDNGETHLGRLVVGADGANSMVRQAAGIESLGWDYEQQGVVATLAITANSEDPDNTTAWQRYLPTGPLALLPVRETCFFVNCVRLWLMSFL